MKPQMDAPLLLRKNRRVAATTELTTGRYTVGLLGGRKMKQFSKKRSAIEFARVLARRRNAEVVMHDRGARLGSQQIWLLNDRGLIRTIGHRTVLLTSETVH